MWRAREPTQQAEDAPRPPRPAPPSHALLDLQRTAGNQAVAQLLSRQAVADQLPASAAGLKAFRAGLPRLQALASRVPPPPAPADLRPALDWIGELVDTLTLVEPIADPSNLLFESLTSSDHDEEYSRAGSEIRPALAAALAQATPGAQRLGETLSREVIAQINRSSVAAEDREAEPTLPDLSDVQAWARRASALKKLAGKVDRDGGLAAAASACEDAALAMLQARAVLSARDTWREDDAQSSTPAQIGTAGRPRNEVDDIFADSGFSNRQSLRENGARHDWCGMFVSASMFRGAALDKNVRMALAHTNNVFDFFSYNRSPSNPRRTPKSIWAEGQWWNLRDYHRERGLERSWLQGAAIREGDIRPGDVALIRHRGTAPAAAIGIANHIVMVESWDPETGKLVTIEGNVDEGIRPDADGEAQRTEGGDLASTRTRAPSSTAVHVRDMDDQRTLTPGAGPGGAYREKGARTVYGVGRPSLVDFESHEYGLDTIPDDLKYVSPAEMRLIAANRRRLAPTSTMQAPT